MTVVVYSITVMKTHTTFSLKQISTLTELSRRTVRYYIQSGLVDRPEGTGKGAYYTDKHIEQLLLIRKWQLAGLSLKRIAELLKQQASGQLPPTPRRAGTVEVWSHLVVADGVEVNIEPGRAGLSPEEVREFFKQVTNVFLQIQGAKENQ